MARWALGLEYDGTPFGGWQSQQKGLPTVQQVLERALSHVADHPITVHAAGRTDKGVHATGQCVHWDTSARRPSTAWITGTNHFLPPTIRIQWARPVDPYFDARRSAWYRSYRYYLCCRDRASAHGAQLYTQTRHTYAIAPMQEAARWFLGEQDFSAMRAAACQSRSPMRCVYDCRITETGPWICIDVQANAFLHHMVRNMVGALCAVGRGKSPDWIRSLLASRDRTQSAPCAPASGLYLVAVGYPEEYQFPIPRDPILQQEISA